MTYVPSKMSRRGPALVKPPRRLPQENPVARQVVATAELWEEMTEVAQFQVEAFRLMGSKEPVYRNDMAVTFLTWGMAAFWEDVGGRPSSKQEWAEKVKKLAQILEAERAHTSKK